MNVFMITTLFKLNQYSKTKIIYFTENISCHRLRKFYISSGSYLSKI